MSSYRFSTGQHFSLRGNLYQVKKVLLAEQQINVENLDTGGQLTICLSELTTALFSGELHFETEAKKKSRAKICMDLAAYPESAVEIARWRLKVIEPLLEIPFNELTLGMVDERVDAVKNSLTEEPKKLANAVSRASAYRWLKTYRSSSNDLRALIPELSKRGGTGKTRLKAEVNALVQSILQDNCLRPEKISIDDLLCLIAAQIAEENQLRPDSEKLSMPSRATIVRRIDGLDIKEHFAAKHGRRAARREFSQADQMNYPSSPYERVEIDHTSCDILVIDERDNLPLGRPTLTYCLDLATRYPLGYYLGFEPPSYFTVMECLYHAICPKGDIRKQYATEHAWLAHGVPSTLVVDNGKEFIGQDLSDACELLGIVLQQCPVATPEFKAGVERHFRTLNSGVFHTLPGTTFSNIVERGEYNSARQACISLNELEKALTIFLVDIYAERRHRGLKGVPARRWEQAMDGFFMPRLPPGRDELSILLGRVEWRTLHPYGVEFECLRYNAPDLGLLRARLRGQKVKLKYHPGDLGHIYVFDPFEKIYLEVPALNQEYATGLSFWKHRLIRRAAMQETDQVDLAALGRARLKIQEIVEAARSRKRTTTRQKVARWDGQAPSLEKQKRSTKTPLPQPPKDLEVDIASGEVYEYDYSLPPSRQE